MSMEKSENYVSKTIMHLLVICKLMNVTYGELEYASRNHTVTGSRCAALCLNLEDKRKESSHKPVLENFSTTISLPYLIPDRQNHPNNVLLNYLNIRSLRYKITNLKILVPQFLRPYLVISEKKLNEEFPSAQFLISDYVVKSKRDRSKHGKGLLELFRKSLICMLNTI